MKNLKRKHGASGRSLIIAAQFLTVMLLLVAVVYALMVGYSVNSNYFRLSSVKYEGNNRLDVESLNRLIANSFPTNVLKIDLDRLRALVESETWVKSAVIRRRLPDQLVIYVQERKPVAVATIEHELKVVDEEGTVLASFGPDYQTIDQPIVKGLRNTALENAHQENADRMKLYLRVVSELSAGPEDYTPKISEIDVADTEHVAVVQTDDPVPIYLGRENFGQRYRSFLARFDLYQQVKSQYGSIKSVDVTIDDQIIIHTADNSVSSSGKERAS